MAELGRGRNLPAMDETRECDCSGLLGGNRELQDPAWISRKKEIYWKLTCRRDRLAVFYIYGADNTVTSDFYEANMNRHELLGWGPDAAEILRPALSSALASEGVALSAALMCRDGRAITAERGRELLASEQRG